MGKRSPELLHSESDVPAGRTFRKVVTAMYKLPANERQFFERVVDAVVAEAIERHIELIPAVVTLRLLCAYERGMRDEEELKDAVLFNGVKVYLQ